MKNMNRLFGVFVAFAFVGCAVPLAKVQVHQALPMALPKGCHYVNYVDAAGDEGGNFVNISGLTTDPGLTYMQVSYGNSLQTMACSDAAMQANYGEMYKSYMAANFSGKDEDLKKEVDSMKVAVLKLSDSMVDLAAITAASKPTPVEDEKKDAKGKDAKKGGKPEAAPVIAPQLAPVTSAVPAAVQPVAKSMNLKAQIAFTANYNELIAVLSGEMTSTSDPQQADKCSRLITLLAVEATKPQNNFATDRAKVLATF